MAEASPEAHQAVVLAIFSKLKEGRISAGDLKKKLAARPKAGQAAGPDDPEADRALAGLIEQGLLSVSGGGKDGHHPRPNASYRLTEKGRQHLRPIQPDLEPKQLHAQESFILLQVFRAKERTLTRSGLNDKLKSLAAKRQLEFDVKAAPGTVDYHLAQLVEKGYLDEQRQGVSVRFTFNPEKGPKALASAKQHDNVTFTMTGEILNALLDAARQSMPGRSEAAVSHVPELPIEAAPAPASRALGEPDIVKYIDHLRADKYAGKGLIPIHEVRRLVAEHHGDEAASHPAFDPLIKRMRSEKQLELIAISDNRRATPEQLDASIPGVNETIFYIVVE